MTNRHCHPQYVVVYSNHRAHCFFLWDLCCHQHHQHPKATHTTHAIPILPSPQGICAPMLTTIRFVIAFLTFALLRFKGLKVRCARNSEFGGTCMQYGFSLYCSRGWHPIRVWSEVQLQPSVLLCSEERRASKGTLKRLRQWGRTLRRETGKLQVLDWKPS